MANKKNIRMRANYYLSLLPYLLSVLTPFALLAQNSSDCEGAQVICTSGTTSFNPQGSGDVDDFGNPNNNQGCLSSGELNTVWYYFEFDGNTVPGEFITFVISPDGSADYDFAVYGPDANCGNLGNPIRCSYAAGSSDTGLSTGAADNSEGAGGDGFVSEIEVQPGQGFYLAVDNFSGNNTSFELSWGGTASDNLNCNPCALNVLSYTPSWDVCPGGPGVTFDIVMEGATSSTLYEWTSPDGGMPYLSNPFILNPTVTLPEGVTGSFTYNLTVTEGSCTEAITVTVTAAGVPALSISGDNTVCTGESSTLTASPGNLSSYVWSNGASGPSIDVSTGGNYTLTVTNAAGCSNTASIQVQEFPPPVINISGDQTICSGGSALLSADPGYPSYLWNTSQSSPTIEVFNPGLYTVTVTDANGCEGTDDFQVSALPPPEPTINGPSEICPGETGQLEVIETYQNYLWPDGTNTNTFNFSSPGIYTVTVTDFDGCQGTASYTVGQATQPSPVIVGDETLCPGSIAQLEVVGAYEQYEWSSGGTTPSISVAVPGTYTVTVANAAGCSGTNSFTINEANPTPPSISGPTELCLGEVAQLEATSGYASYLWSTGSTVATAPISSPGTFSLTVTDIDGCELVSTYTVAEALPPSPVIEGNTTFCEGSSTTLTLGQTYASYAWSTGSTAPSIEASAPGTISVTVTNNSGCEGTANVNLNLAPTPVAAIAGPDQICPDAVATLETAPGFYSYQWSAGSVTHTQSVLAPGVYSLTVTNASGCEGETSFTVGQAPSPSPLIEGPTEYCAGGAAQLSVSSSYASVNWSNAQSGSSILADQPGLYEVTVENAEGCTGTASVTITENPLPQPAITAPDGFCGGTSATLSTTPGYDAYLWSDGSDGVATEVLLGGTYSLSVTDNKGCEGSTSVEVDMYEPPTPVIEGPASICQGDTAELTASGGAYSSFQWSNASTDPNTTVSSSGNYALTVTDLNGCSGTADTQLEVTPNPSASISGALEFCAGGSATLEGPAGLASYQWSNGSDSSAIHPDSAGTYALTVTDANGCQNNASVELSVNPLPDAEIQGLLSFCADGSTILSAPAGLGYAWSDGSSSPSISVSTPGDYSVTVEDSNNCFNSDTVSVEEVEELLPQINGPSSFCSGESITLAGEMGYETYSWSNGATGPAITVDTAGTYSLTVEDANGCQGQQSVTLTENKLPEATIEGSPAFCAGGSTSLSAAPGFSAYLWSDSSTTAGLTAEQPGTYSLTLTDANGCQASTSVQVEELPLPEPQIEGTLSFCPDDSSTLSLSAGYASYNWSNGASTPSIVVNQAGNFSVNVIDENGCAGADTVTTQLFGRPAPAIEGALAYCAGESTVLQSDGAYAAYAWSDGSNGPTALIDTPGEVLLTVTDGNGCTASTSATVVENPLPEPTISGPEQFCAGSSTLLVGAAGFQDYHWSTQDSSSSITVAAGGTYTLSVTDANGCQGTADFELEAVPLPEPSIIGHPQFCPGDSTTLNADQNYSSYLWTGGNASPSLTVTEPGDITLTVSNEGGCTGSTTLEVSLYETEVPQIDAPAAFCPEGSASLQAESGFATYLWSGNQTAPGITVEEPGTYSLTVSDSNGCTSSSSVSLDVFEVEKPAIDGPLGFCQSSTAELQADPGFAAYEWSNGANTPSINTSEGGLYRLTVTDANGCTASNSFQLTENPLPNVTIGGSTAFCPGGFAVLNAGDTYDEYLWSDGSTEPELQVSQEGNYSLTVTDENGCVNSAEVEVSEQAELSPVISGALAFCPGGSTELSAGSGFTEYNWSTGSQGTRLQVSEPGTYGLTVTDASGCSGETSVEVAVYAQTVIDISGATGFCQGESAELAVNGEGISAYDWSQGSFEPSISVQQPGTYSVTITDTNGCQASASREVEEYPLPEFDISGQAYFCKGSTTLLAGPEGFAAYEWSDGSTGNELSVGAPGPYALQVTDDNGCRALESLLVEEIPLPQADAGSGAALTCEQTALTLGGPGTVTGPDFTYQWQGPGITADNEQALYPEVESPGSYQLLVTDTLHGCVSMPATVEVTQDTDLPSVLLSADDTLDCATASVLIDGSASDNGPDFSFSWYDNAQELIATGTDTLAVEQSGTYFLEIADGRNGCRRTESITITEDYATPAAEAGPSQRLDCAQTSVLLDGSGSSQGEALYYEWQDEAGQLISTDPTCEVSSPGWHFLTLLNSQNGCQSWDSVLVTEDTTAPIAEAGPDQSIDCLSPTVKLDGSGSSTGANFTQEWAFETPENIVGDGLSLNASESGTYLLIVTNQDNQCESVAAVEVNENSAAPEALLTEPDDPTCFGDEDGSIAILGVEGGTSPYLYSFNGQPYSAETQFTGLGAGTYSLAVQDAIGCEYELSIELEEGNDLWVDAGPDREVSLGEDVQLSAATAVPLGALQGIRWSGPDSIACPSCLDTELMPASSGLYTIEITDSNGCTASDELRIFLDKSRQVYAPNAFSPNGDNSNDVFFLQSGPEVVNINFFEVYNRWGEPVFFLRNAPANDPDFGWDGSFRGERMNGAVFVWQAEVEFVDGETALFKGEVLLMR